MKLFAIITAGLMAAGAGVYFYSTYSPCSKGGCPAPVAKTGGCCDGTEPVKAATSCCPNPCDECVAKGCTGCDLCATCCGSAKTAAKPAGACCATEKVAAKPDACCAAKDECCLVQAACCAAEKVAAKAKPREIVGCCDEGCASPARAVTDAAKSIAGAK